MDLRSIINDEGSRAPPKQAAPVTPIQAPPQHSFRDYGHPSYASPSKHPSQDFGPPANLTYSPKPIQGGYQGRPPQPPPIQPPSQPILQSPARSYSAQSPYQHTPSSSMSGNQYPFPSNHHQTPQSPAQHTPYPPSFPQRDNYSQGTPTAAPQQMHHQPHASPVPQTPPVGISGAPPPFLQHQRSQSSTSTPNSVHSQPPAFNQYPSHESPITATHYPPPPQHVRQQSQHSQPGTPLGPPLSQRHSSGGFTQPNSPYQQRGVPPPPYPQYQTSPAPVPQRLPTTPNPYQGPQPSVIEQHRRSQSERERSMSVSPKTRVPSQPRIDVPQVPQPPVEAYNSAKRKMDDRETSVESQRRVSQPESKPHVNGEYAHAPPVVVASQPPAKRRKRYAEPPIWARSVRAKNAGTFGGNRGLPTTNGKPPQNTLPPQPEVNGHHSPQSVRGAPQISMDSHPSNLLGPWEDSIMGVKPTEELVRQVADFIFQHVVSRPDLGELQSRGVDVEIEAKMGQFIESSSGQRISLGVLSECVMVERRQLSFRSAMTVSQHEVLNQVLNDTFKEAHPKNPNRSKRRVSIGYKHRREIDKFYELPPPVISTLPPAVSQNQGFRGARLRVTHDQESNQILAAIIKVRIADMSIHLPQQPLDCRISVNFEMKYDGDVDAVIAQSQYDRSNDRSKDRVSYKQGHYQVDLTQVTKVKDHNGTDFVEKEHELEVEVDTNTVLDQGNRARSGQPNEYLSLMEGFVNNIRVIARAVPPS